MTSLDPIKHKTAERLAAEMVDIFVRLQALEQSRARVSFGHGPPATSDGAIGSMYVDVDSARVYVLGPDGWISADVRRQGDVKYDTVTTAEINPVVDLGGPSVTVEVPDDGFVMALISADVQGGSSDVSTAQAAVWLHEPTDIPDPFATGSPPISSAGGADWTSKLSAPNTTAAGASAINGAVFPYGDFLVFRATPGTRTYSLRYSAANSPGGINVSFRNRKLMVLVV